VYTEDPPTAQQHATRITGASRPALSNALGVQLLSDPEVRLTALLNGALLPYPPAAPPLYAPLEDALDAPMVLTELGHPNPGANFVEVSNAAPTSLDLGYGSLHLACWTSNGVLQAIDDLNACGIVEAGQCCVLCNDTLVFAATFPRARCDASLVGCASATDAFALVHLPPWLLALSPTERATAAPPDLRLHDMYGHAAPQRARRLAHGTSFARGHAERVAGAITPRSEWQSVEWTVRVPADASHMTPGVWDRPSDGSDALAAVLVPLLLLAMAVLGIWWHRRRRKGTALPGAWWSRWRRAPKVTTTSQALPPGALSTLAAAPTAESSTSEQPIQVEEISPAPAASTPRTAAELLRRFEIAPEDLEMGALLSTAGGQADVYQGRWRGLRVAVKQLRALPTEALAPAVRRELRALSRVQHPNVVRLHGVCMQPVARVVLPLADGSLRDALTTANVPSTTPLLCGIARGMVAIHAHAILHLDLKPENVLLSHGEPWVTDFGLATSQAVGSASALSSVAARGTIRYKAPELFRLRRQGGALVSTAADVYSFALIAWELAVGEVPWAGMSDPEVMANVMAGERPLLQSGAEWEGRASPGLAKLITTCWVQDEERDSAHAPSARPSFEQLVTDLEKMEDAAREEAVASPLAPSPPLTPRGTPIGKPEAATDGLAIGRPVDRLEEMDLTVVELRAQIVELEAARVASEAERSEVREEVQALRVALRTAEADVRRLEVLAGGRVATQMRAMLSEAERRLAVQQMETRAMLADLQQQLRTALVAGNADCPRLPWIHGGARGRYRLYFVCPVALEVAETNDGSGYDVHLPRAALRSLAPALHVTIHALRSKLGSGQAVGLPLRHRANRSPAAIQRVELSTIDALERSLPHPEGPRMMSQRVGAVPNSTYKMLRTTLETEDPGLAHCGLVRLKAADKTVAWVRPGAAAERFRSEGKRALGRVEVVSLRLLA